MRPPCSLEITADPTHRPNLRLPLPLIPLLRHPTSPPPLSTRPGRRPVLRPLPPHSPVEQLHLLPPCLHSTCDTPSSRYRPDHHVRVPLDLSRRIVWRVIICEHVLPCGEGRGRSGWRIGGPQDEDGEGVSNRVGGRFGLFW